MALYEVALINKSYVLVDAPNDTALQIFLSENKNDLEGKYASVFKVESTCVQDKAMYQNEVADISINESGAKIEGD